MRRAGIESTSGPRALTPVHRARSRALSDSRYAALRVDLRLRRVDGRGGSTGRTRLCRRSKALLTRHRPHVRTRNPDGRAHRSMWRPCSPDGELGIGRHRPLRTPAENLAKTASPLELTLGTFVIHTQTKPGSHGAVPGDLGGGPGGRRTAPTAKASAMRDPRRGKRVKHATLQGRPRGRSVNHQFGRLVGDDLAVSASVSHLRNWLRLSN